jgi:hypothetical protein
MLANEAGRRQGAERQAEQLGQRRTELETELAHNKHAQAQLRDQFDESQKQLQHESLQCRQLTDKIAETESAKTQFAAQANSTRELIKAQEDFIRALDLKIRERQGEIARLGALLQSEMVQRQLEQSEIEALELQAAELSDDLLEKIVEQQRFQHRESELEQYLQLQKDQLANSAAIVTIQEAELKNLKATIDDLRVIQSALCARVRELTNQQDTASARILELDRQSVATTRIIKERDQELAALRHAVLDAAVVGTRISSERLQVELQSVDGWKRLMTTLLHTPLSAPQRGLVAETICALDGWRNGRAAAANHLEFQVAPPDLKRSQFNCAQVVESALAAVRKQAEETGAKIQVTLVGQVPECAWGNPGHIHQLITMLAGALPDFAHTEDLHLQLSFDAQPNDTAGLRLSFGLASTQSTETLCLRLRTLTEPSEMLRTGQGGAELIIRSAWQLALALGASPAFEIASDGEVHLHFSLPLPVISAPAPEKETEIKTD